MSHYEPLPHMDSPTPKELVENMRLILEEYYPNGLIVSRIADLVAENHVSKKLVVQGIEIESSTRKRLVNGLSEKVRSRLSTILNARVIPWIEESKREASIKGGQTKELTQWRIMKDQEVRQTYQDKHGGPDPSLLPLWFRQEKSTIITLEKQLEKGFETRDVDIKQVLDDLICHHQLKDSKDVPPLVMETCSKKRRRSNLWDHVLEIELRGKADQEEVLKFVLYKFRSAVVSQVVTFLLDPRYRPERDYIWWEMASLFEDRFRQFKVVSGSSLEKQYYWVTDLFIMLRKQRARKEDIARYVELAFDCMMWFAIKQSNPSFWKEADEAEGRFWGEAKGIVNKHKQLKTIRINLAEDRTRWRKYDELTVTSAT